MSAHDVVMFERQADPLVRFLAALRQVDTEYGRADISASAAMAEVRAALRQLDRHHGRIHKGTIHGKAPV